MKVDWWTVASIALTVILGFAVLWIARGLVAAVVRYLTAILVLVLLGLVAAAAVVYVWYLRS